jgi:hypothetical protein
MLTASGARFGKEEEEKRWYYKVTDESGTEWTMFHLHKKFPLKKGQVVYARVRSGTSIFPITQSEFLREVSRAIDGKKNAIEEAKKDIEALRAL